jgi:hypothetical protein
VRPEPHVWWRPIGNAPTESYVDVLRLLVRCARPPDGKRLRFRGTGGWSATLALVALVALVAPDEQQHAGEDKQCCRRDAQHQQD